jgi:arylsulfatase A-like enzyme
MAMTHTLFMGRAAAIGGPWAGDVSMSRMTYHSTAGILGTAPRIRRWVRASLVALAIGLVGCGATPSEHESIDLTQLGYGVVDGHFTPLDVEKAGRLRQAAAGDLDLFVNPPPDAALLFGVPGGLAPASFAVSVRTDDGEHAVHLQHEDGGGYRVALGDLAGRSTEIRLTNRASGPLTWIRPRVEGTFETPTPTFTPAPRPSGKRYNVLLYVIDTLRADHLTCYGYHRATTPRIDEYASHGTLFENAYSMASSTPPSMSSIFASRHPSEIRSHLDPKGAARETLGEAFQRAGWATAGFQANLLLRRPLGFARGFDHYEIPTRRPFKKVKPVRAEQLHERVLAWLAKRPAKPFFMWVQSMDVHEYDPVPPYAGRYTNPTHATTTTTRLEDVDNPYLMLGRFTPEYYDETLAYADHFLGKLLDDLRAQGILQDTIVVITADHGEPLGEHGTYFHGMNVYEEVIHVPLVVLLPWDTTPRRITRLTSLLDLAPTLTALAGVPTPPGWEGRSLLAPPAPHARTIAFGATEGRENKDPSWFLRTGPWKVVMDREKSRLFDLRTDPDEVTDVAHQHPVTAQDLFSLLVSRTPEFRKGWKQPPPWDADLNPAEKARLHEALQALGYVH